MSRTGNFNGFFHTHRVLIFICCLYACKKSSNSTTQVSGDDTYVKVYQNVPIQTAGTVTAGFSDPAGNLYTFFFNEDSPDVYYEVKTDSRGNFVNKTQIPYRLYLYSNNVGYSTTGYAYTATDSAYFIAIDTAGRLIYKTSCLPFTGSSNYLPTGLYVTKENYLLTTHYYYDSLNNLFSSIGCISNSGAIIWDDSLLSDTFFRFSGAVETADGNFLFVGGSSNTIGSTFIETDNQGNVLWSKNQTQVSNPQALIKISDTRYIVTCDSLHMALIDTGANFISSSALQLPYGGQFQTSILKTLVTKEGNALLLVHILYNTVVTGSPDVVTWCYEIAPDLSLKKSTPIGNIGFQLDVLTIVPGVNEHYYLPGTISNLTYNNYLFVAKTTSNVQF